MRKFAILLFLGMFFAEPVCEAAFRSKVSNYAKPKVYKKKKGFLWGLFKKKPKKCDCPNL
jgi:hypothetical protein